MIAFVDILNYTFDILKVPVFGTLCVLLIVFCKKLLIKIDSLAQNYTEKVEELKNKEIKCIEDKVEIYKEVLPILEDSKNIMDSFIKLDKIREKKRNEEMVLLNKLVEKLDNGN